MEGYSFIYSNAEFTYSVLLSKSSDSLCSLEGTGQSEFAIGHDLQPGAVYAVQECVEEGVRGERR